MADIVTVYRRHGQIVTPPAPTGDDELDDALYENFALTIQRSDWCSEDGTEVYPSRVCPSHELFCSGEHRWLWLSEGFDNYSRAEINPGWRQVQ